MSRLPSSATTVDIPASLRPRPSSSRRRRSWPTPLRSKSLETRKRSSTPCPRRKSSARNVVITKHSGGSCRPGAETSPPLSSIGVSNAATRGGHTLEWFGTSRLTFRQPKGLTFSPVLPKLLRLECFSRPSGAATASCLRIRPALRGSSSSSRRYRGTRAPSV